MRRAVGSLMRRAASVLRLAIAVCSALTASRRRRPRAGRSDARCRRDRSRHRCDRVASVRQRRHRCAARSIADARIVDRVGRSGARYAPGRVIVKFRDGMIRRRARPRAVARRRASRVDGRTTRRRELRRRPDRSGRGRRSGRARLWPRAPTSSTRRPAYRVRPALRAERSAVHATAVEPAADRSGARLGHPARRRRRRSSSRCSTPASRITDAIVQLHARRSRSLRTGVSYPALGLVDVPFARARRSGGVGQPGDARFVAPHDFIWDDTHPLDIDGHGTHVSGTIGQLTNNNVGARRRRVQREADAGEGHVDDDWDDIFGSPNVGTDDIVAQGIRYAADNGAKVINMSIGRTGHRSAPVVEDAIRYAVGKGVLHRDRRRQRFRGRQSDSRSRRNRVAGAGRGVGGGGRSAAAPRVLLEHRSWVELAAPGGRSRVGGERARLSADLRLRPRRHLRSAAGAVQGAALRCARVRRLRGDVDGDAARPGARGAADAAGHQSPAAIEAALEKFATDLGPPGRDNEYRLRRDQRARTRCADWGCAK